LIEIELALEQELLCFRKFSIFLEIWLKNNKFVKNMCSRTIFSVFLRIKTIWVKQRNSFTVSPFLSIAVSRFRCFTWKSKSAVSLFHAKQVKQAKQRNNETKILHSAGIPTDFLLVVFWQRFLLSLKHTLLNSEKNLTSSRE